ncbi:hypothetical protein [Marivirga arenosa]|uniref:Uncharacterized protein n=1 Tax=Marivirga arenosa TaxID=3059076 RepID=A0AA51N4L4_9BACT|nr:MULTISPECIES: hypothetical protein [unclassified Marivirga]WMN05894.1 hypothetical protein QYS48_30915 [Marivirga sp. ABR2-2]WNB17725.1 hypothetical protein QYS47_34800 [Marivirga sp. BKB1-2]
MKKVFILSIFMIALLFDAKSQKEDPFDYGQEFLFGITKATNGGLFSGGFFRYSAKKSDRIFQTFGIEVANIRHPQERRVPSPTFFSTSSFYEGKEKYLISTRLMYGYDMLLFKKAEEKGVQINGVLTGGPTLGFVSPYLLRSEGGGLVTYSQFLNGSAIIGPAGYFAGIDQMELVLGAHIRASLLFEFGTFKSKITGFEVGFLGEIFSREIQIVPLGTKNYSFYPAAFVSILFGSRK